MSTINILTNRPKFSYVHPLGHITFYVYSNIVPVITIKVDGMSVNPQELYNQTSQLYILHIPNTIFKNANKLKISINDYTYTIKVKHKACKTYTIAWLNPLGGVDHYTFYSGKEESISVSKERILLNEGFKTISSTVESNVSVYSDFETNDIKQWLSEIISSPKTALLQEGNMTHIDVTTDNANTFSDNLEQIEFKFRYNPVKMQLP